MPQYLAHVDRRLQEEHERLIYYLDASTRRMLIYSVEKQLISEHLVTLLQKGLDQLLEQGRHQELRLLYSLVSRVKNGLVELGSGMNTYVKVGLGCRAAGLAMALSVGWPYSVCGKCVGFPVRSGHLVKKATINLCAALVL